MVLGGVVGASAGLSQPATKRATARVRRNAIFIMVWGVRPGRLGWSGNYWTRLLGGVFDGVFGFVSSLISGFVGVFDGVFGGRTGFITGFFGLVGVTLGFAARNEEGGNEGQEICDFHVVMCLFVFV